MKNSISMDSDSQLPKFRQAHSRLLACLALMALVSVVAGWSPSPLVGPRAAFAQESSSSKSPAADQPKTSKAAKSDGKTSADPVASSAPPAIGNLFPVGREFRGVKIPSYSGDILNSVVLSQTMVRVDDEHLEMRDLKITLFGRSSEERDTVISTDVGVYDLKSETLTSRSKAFIEREKGFTMEGDRMIFRGKTQEGRLVGNVKMIILNVSETFNNP